MNQLKPGDIYVIHNANSNWVGIKHKIIGIKKGAIVYKLLELPKHAKEIPNHYWNLEDVYLEYFVNDIKILKSKTKHLPEWL